MYRVFISAIALLFLSQSVYAQPCATICNKTDAFCDDYDALPTINRDLPYSPLFGYGDVCLRGHEWYSLQTLRQHSGVWSYHKGVSLQNMAQQQPAQSHRIQSILDYYRSLPGDPIEWQDDLEFLDSLEDNDVISLGGSSGSFDVLYAAYRMLKSATTQLANTPTPERTHSRQLSGGFRLLEGAMYLSSVERDEDAYALASGTRDCILEALVLGNAGTVENACLIAMRERLSLIWEASQNDD